MLLNVLRYLSIKNNIHPITQLDNNQSDEPNINQKLFSQSFFQKKETIAFILPLS